MLRSLAGWHYASNMRRIILIAHDIRSSHNVGSLLRTADGLGVEKVYLTGFSPYPPAPGDARLPHEAQKTGRDIHKTALGAEMTQAWEHHVDIEALLKELTSAGFTIVALEQTPSAIPLPGYKAPQSVALILGNEVTGMPNELLCTIREHVVIPMTGTKESFNVASAAAMALYALRFC